jgi:hypothetical protein
VVGPWVVLPPGKRVETLGLELPHQGLSLLIKGKKLPPGVWSILGNFPIPGPLTSGQVSPFFPQNLSCVYADYVALIQFDNLPQCGLVLLGLGERLGDREEFESGGYYVRSIGYQVDLALSARWQHKETHKASGFLWFWLFVHD